MAAAVPDVVSLLEQNNTFPGTWCATIDLANAFFSRLVNKTVKQIAISWHGQQYTCTVLPEGCINSPVLICPNLFHRTHHLSLTQLITLVQHSDEIVLIRSSEQELYFFFYFFSSRCTEQW